MIEMVLTATPSGFIPQPEAWEAYEEAFTMGEDYLSKVSQPRNLGNHRRFYKFLDALYDRQEVYTNKEDLRTELKLRSGHYKEHINVKGDIMYIPKSMDFATLDELEFKQFFSKCIDVALKHFLKCSEVEAAKFIAEFG